MRYRWPTLASLAALLLLSSACSLEPRHGYVQSADGSLSFRHPQGWEPVDLAPQSSEWVAAIDAADQPSLAHIDTLLLDDPFVVAIVFPLDEDDRDRITLSSLRHMALGGQVDPTATDDPGVRVRFHDTIVDEHGFEGHHVRFEVDLEQGTVVEEQYAVFDPGRYRIHQIRVACRASCFDANLSDIDDLFQSVTLQP